MFAREGVGAGEDPYNFDLAEPFGCSTKGSRKAQSSKLKASARSSSSKALRRTPSTPSDSQVYV